MYAIDLMLDWRDDANNNAKTIEPIICEINFMPGNKKILNFIAI